MWFVFADAPMTRRTDQPVDITGSLEEFGHQMQSFRTVQPFILFVQKTEELIHDHIVLSLGTPVNVKQAQAPLMFLEFFDLAKRTGMVCSHIVVRIT